MSDDESLSSVKLKVKCIFCRNTFYNLKLETDLEKGDEREAWCPHCQMEQELEVLAVEQ